VLFSFLTEDAVKLDLRALLAGECRTLPFRFYLDPPDVSDPRSSLWGVRFPSPMEVDGSIINTAGYMRMSLNLSLDYTASCARCLADVSGTFRFDLEKTVAPASQLEGLDEDKKDDFAIVEDGFLDMDEQLLELLEMEFPSRFLCKEDCLGLCEKCGANLNDGPCSCQGEEIDPRLLPLKEILEKLKKAEEDQNNS
jgi:uncharacterized protein